MSAAEDATRLGRTQDPLISRIFIAEGINRRNGGSVIAPWELEKVPDDYVIAYRALIAAERKAQSASAYQLESEMRHAQMRRNHPTYRKYLS